MIHKNQLNPPPSKKKRVDSVGNDKRKLWLRSGGKDDKTTMLIVDGLTENGCKAVEYALNDVLKKLGKEPISNRLLVTR